MDFFAFEAVAFLASDFFVRAPFGAGAAWSSFTRPAAAASVAAPALLSRPSSVVRKERMNHWNSSSWATWSMRMSCVTGSRSSVASIAAR